MGSLANCEISGHILLVCAPLWGHLRPLSCFAGKALGERTDISITFLVAGANFEKVQMEVSRYIPDNKPEFQSRIRIVQIGGEKISDRFQLFDITSTSFPEYYEKLVLCEPIQCKSSGTIFPGIRSPTLAIVDFFLLSVLETISARSGNTIPILAWTSANVYRTIRAFGPEELGGIGDVKAKTDVLMKETGRAEEDIMEELSRPKTGTVTLPGLPTLYNHEWFPQEPDVTPYSTLLINDGYILTRKCDGYVSTSSSVYEPESARAFHDWLQDTGKQGLYAVGPLVPPGVGNPSKGVSAGAKSFELAMSENGHEFQLFMDNIAKSHGKQSLIYISFGSLWWPKNENVLLFVDVLLELGVPFILSTRSPKAHIPAELHQNVKASGIGMITNWSPQQTIFNHPVTGWVVTHCGQSTVMEALAEGLPMIAWPINADQPANSTHMVINLDVAFELVEVRSGALGLKPLYRGVQAKGTQEALVAEAKSVLVKMRGEEGARKRRNAEAIRDKFRMSWEEGGEALENMRKILRVAAKKDSVLCGRT